MRKANIRAICFQLMGLDRVKAHPMTAGLAVPRARIATTLNVVALIIAIALTTLCFAAIHFSGQISRSAAGIKDERLAAVVKSAELGVLAERHRRIVEAGQHKDSAEASERRLIETNQIAGRIHDIVALSEPRAVAPIARLLPDLFDRGNKVLLLQNSQAPAQAPATAVADYEVMAKRIQDRIVTFREFNLRRADEETASLSRNVRTLMTWIVGVTLFSSVLAGPLTVLTMRKLAERLKEITRTMQALSNDNTDIEIPHVETSDEVGEMARAIAVFKANAIALHQKHEEIALLHSRFDVALNNMTRGLSMFDRESRLIVCNRICRDMYGLPEALTSAGTPFREIVLACALAHAQDPPDEIAAQVDTWLNLHAAQIEEGHEFSTIHRIDDKRIYAISTKPLPEGGWVDIHEDVTEEFHTSERIADLAQKDTLTGLANRHSFLLELTAMFQGGRDQPTFAVLWIDLDRFKNVNDTYGHPAGDALLQEIALRLKSAVRPTDFVARLGGDEFAIILRANALPQATLARIAARITSAVCQPVEVLGNTIRVGASIGVSSAPLDASSPEEIMSTADLALYRAKADGRGKAVFFTSEMAEELSKRRRLERDLKTAIDVCGLELWYQPIVSLTTGKTVCFEALMRWNHPEFGPISPGTFIPIAEEAGHIDALGAWALTTACRTAAGWPDDVSVSVNLSAAQFAAGNLPDTAKAALTVSGLAPRRLEFEITEALLLDRQQETWGLLSALRRMGLGIALDDFGTGYSSLSHLRNFPFAKIKIDPSLVRLNADAPSNDPAIMPAIVNLAHTLQMKVVAEGIETRAQLNQARAANCDEAQGYLFSHPVPADQTAAFLAGGRRIEAA